MATAWWRHQAALLRRSPIKVRGRLPELRRRARTRLPSATLPSQQFSPHLVGSRIVRRRPHHPRRQRLEPLVVPPLRLGHLGARLLAQHAEGRCRGLCPGIRAHRVALLGLEESLRGLHVVPRVVERCTEAEVRIGPVGPQGDGLAAGLGCSAPVLLRAVLHTLSNQLLVLVARLRSAPGLPLRDLAILLLRHATILRPLPKLLHLLATQHQYVVGTFSLTHFGHTGCFTRSSSISDGSLAQPKQARLTASDAGKGAPLSPAAGGAAAAAAAAAAGSAAAAGGVAAASVASLSAFSAVSASRTSLLPALRSGCCSRSLASSGLGPRLGSASHSPRTASRRASVIQKAPHPPRPQVWEGERNIAFGSYLILKAKKHPPANFPRAAVLHVHGKLAARLHEARS
eukprot:scaffold46035_cov65-Phaeocystis_antarctica.AAC.2